MTMADADGDGQQQLLVGSDDFEARCDVNDDLWPSIVHRLPPSAKTSPKVRG